MSKKYALLPSSGSDYHARDSWETLDNCIACSACSDLLNHLGININYPLQTDPIYVLSGFSGVGKGRICEQLQNKKLNGKPIRLIRSVTSRKPRFATENYTFVTPEEFTQLIEENKLLEYNNSYVNNSYGTPAEDVREAHSNNHAVLLEIDRVGLTHLLTDGKVNPSLIRAVFITADAQTVVERLHQRGTEDNEEIRARLNKAINESYSLDLYDAIIENNNDIKNTVDAVIAAFEGIHGASNFDSEKFRIDMQHILESFSN